jgi:hypothetical protein
MRNHLLQLSAVSFEQLATVGDELLLSSDIAALNLVAARGLPDTESMDIAALLAKLDEWAERARTEIMRHLYRFDPRAAVPPSEFNYGWSFARFLCHMLLQVLQEDCGVRYNPARKFDPDFCEPEDVFIHGIIQDGGAGGTCASMPVVYVAVGRRLGLPLKLVEGRGHYFFRWDDSRGTTIRWPSFGECWIPPDRFNVEGAGEGIAFHDDAHYIQWPKLWTEVDFAHGRYLRSLTPKEEFASFLIQRGECFWDLGQHLEALTAYHFARLLVPEDERYERLHGARQFQYDQLQVHEVERIMDINERNRQAIEARKPRFQLPPGRPLKIAFGKAPPPDLPRETPIRYVPAEEADPWPLPSESWPGQLQSSGVTYIEDPLTAMKRIKEQNRRLMLQQETRKVLVRFWARRARSIDDTKGVSHVRTKACEIPVTRSATRERG